MNKVWEDPKTIHAMCEAYDTGQTVKQVADSFGISTGKTYYLLRDAGCRFRPKRDERTPWTEESRRKLSIALKGRKRSDEARKRMSEASKKHFDGMNSIGHLKQHQSGYVIAYVPDHPRATKDGYVMLHTIVMERALGRYLENNEEVHHINHIRNDNRIENLRLMDKHEHHSMHMKERRAKVKGEMTY